MAHATSVLLLLCILIPSNAFPAVRGDRAMYAGGTLSSIKPGTMGVLDLSGETSVMFNSECGEKLSEIPYSKITKVEYGQFSQRRIKSGGAAAGSVGMAVAGGVLAAPVVVPLLLTKRKKHYVTVFFTDQEGKGQTCVYEVGKKHVRVTLKTLEARTGKEVAYESEEAKKQLR